MTLETCAFEILHNPPVVNIKFIKTGGKSVLETHAACLVYKTESKCKQKKNVKISIPSRDKLFIFSQQLQE